MSVSVTLNSLAYTIPSTGETGWGASVTAFIQAVGSSTLQKSGGTFTLTADADFGASYGLKASYFTSRTANAASAGALRLARADGIKWRNQANGADLTLGVDSSNNLEWESVDVVTVSGTQTLTNKTLTPESWTTATLTAPWASYDGGSTYAVPRYRKDAAGTVHISGTAKAASNPGANSTLFTLPSGYRPDKEMFFAVWYDNGSPATTRLEVYASGAVKLTPDPGAAVGFLQLDVSFSVG